MNNASDASKVKVVDEDISIIMAVYNHEETLVDAIESALMQDMPYSSVIYCIDDKSTDSSASILKDYSEKYPDKIKVFTSKENQGSGKKAFLHNRPPARGKYWCLLAGDDYWTSADKLDQQITFLNENLDYVGCSCDSEVNDEKTGLTNIIKPSKPSWNLFDLSLLKHKYAFYVHTTSIVWRNIYLKDGFFLPPDFQKKFAFGDVVLGHMMLAKGGKMYNISKVMSCYRITGRGVWTSKTPQEQAEMNGSLKSSLHKALPLKYKIIIFLHKYLPFSTIWKRFLPGPINE